jgi:hypothetical protein
MAAHDTPPLESFDSRDCDFFSRTYVPLSNLPTPPSQQRPEQSTPSLHDRSTTAKRRPDSALQQHLLGPAVHLANLVPSSVSLLDPCPQRVHDMLGRARLPEGTLALACGILDSLNSRFAKAWRAAVSRESRRLDGEACVDRVRPELIVLSAIVLAVKFLDDRHASTSWYADTWGACRWSCRLVNATEHCILQNLGYRLISLTDSRVLDEAKHEMRLAAALFGDLDAVSGLESCQVAGAAALGPDDIITPDLSPHPERRPLWGDGSLAWP